MNFIKNIKFFFQIINHNNKRFDTTNYTNDKKILIEFNNFCSDHIALSYCANILKKKYKANIYAYAGHVLLSYPLKQSLLKKLFFFLGNFLRLKYFGVYKSFGTKKIIFPNYNKKILIKAEETFKIFHSKVKTLKDLESFKVDKLLIGDLLYDTYLKSTYKKIPTINIKSLNFLKFVKEFIILTLYWENYIRINKVKAIISSHTVYSLGLLIRIGIKNKIECFTLSYHEFKRINKKHPRQGYEVKKFKKIFNNLSDKKKKIIIFQSKKKIQDRLMGKYDADYGYITKSPFGLNTNLNIKKGKKKIFIIATHDFVDAPHATGNSIFPDFYHWFLYLCEFSKKSDDIWLVKNHPDFGEDYSGYIKYERDVTKNILKKYPKIKILNKNTTLNDLLKVKVDAVFTVNGTIGFDFALLGVPVINASLNNPHINYKFNLHPKNEIELKNLILNYDVAIKNLKIKKKQLFEFYAMRNIYFSKKWFFTNLDDTTEKIGSFHNFHKPIFYNYWVKNFDKFNENQTKKRINNFIKSKKIFLLNNQNLGNY